MKRLIADSGSTKTDWALTDDGRLLARVATQGINPVHQDGNTIADVLRQELLPQLDDQTAIDEVCFYGSGVRTDLETLMVQLLERHFPGARIEAHSDLLGAALAVCGRREGVACILGTGANSCLFDGRHIVSNTPPLGYVLGDEGSGAVLGRRFLNALLRGRLPETLRQAFAEETGMDYGNIIARVYRQPLANRWLASLSTFIHSHIDVEGVRELVTENFRDFLRLQVAPYGRRDLPVGAVGSIAWFYRDELAQAAHTEGFVLGTVVRSPMDGLLKTLNETK